MKVKNSSIAHVRDERIQNLGKGVLEYSSVNGKSGSIILENIVFSLLRQDGIRVELGKCNKNGNILPTTAKLGVSGYVDVSGGYKLTSIKGVKLISDIIYVSYDYEFDLPVL